jgi:hypothetical protein
MGTLRTAEKIVATFIVLAANNLQADPASPDNDQDRREIERLHEQDVAATLTDDADQLAKLWDEEAVRLQPGFASRGRQGNHLCQRQTMAGESPRWAHFILQTRGKRFANRKRLGVRMGDV